MSLDSQSATNTAAPSSAQDPIDARLSHLSEKLLIAAQSLDREEVLTIVGHPHPTAGMIGDIAGLTALKLPSTLKVEPKDVPWLHAGSGNTCSGMFIKTTSTKIYLFHIRTPQHVYAKHT